MKDAARRRIDRAWHLASHRLKRALGLDRRVRHRHSGQQSPGVGVERVVEQLVALGQFDDASRLAEDALKIERNRNALSSAALAFALTGEASKTQPLIAELEQKYPKDSRVNQLWLPEIKAALELHKGNGQAAVDLLESTRRYEAAGGFWPQTLRAMAYLKLNQGELAAAEARRIVDHRGEGTLSLLWPLAHLSLGRAAVLQGDPARARQSYDEFFKLWANADTDLPILIEAKKEYEKLK